jgi:threonine/homoserine efflux transporter RhtA
MLQQRIDHGPFARFVWLGLAITGVYVLVTPQDQSVASIPNWFDNLLGLAITVGAGLCLAGSYVKDWRTAYRFELGGLALIVVTLGVLAVATDLTLIQQLTLQGGLGGEIQIASIVLGANLWRALRRDVKAAD